MIIIPKHEYRIRASRFFLSKYGTATPKIIIEDTADKVFQTSWEDKTGNPTTLAFGMRMAFDHRDWPTCTVYYGHISNPPNGLGELVTEDELEEIENANDRDPCG